MGRDRDAPGRGERCYYCGRLNCNVRTCPVAADDVQRGICRRDQNSGRILLPNGQPVPPGAPGISIQERVHAWHDRNPGARNQAGVNLLQVNTSQLNSPTERSDTEEIEFLQQKLAMLVERQEKKKQVFDGIELPRRADKGKEREREGR